MRLAMLKDKIRDARNECYKRQQNEKKKKSLAEEVEMNKTISFFAVNSGLDIVLTVLKADKLKWKLMFEQMDNWIKRTYNVSGDMPMNNPKDYGIKKKENTKHHIQLYMLDNEPKD